MTEVTNTKFSRFISSEDGPTAVEYAIMVGLVAMACSAAVISVGSAAADSYADTGSKLANSMSATAGKGGGKGGGAGSGGKQGYSPQGFSAGGPSGWQVKTKK